jgi:hypothetical protein
MEFGRCCITRRAVASTGNANFYGQLVTREGALEREDVEMSRTLVDQVVTEAPELCHVIYRGQD